MRRAYRGFTLAEFIMVIVVLGILSAAVMTNFNAKAQHSVITQADQLRRDLSHMQLLAISRGARLRLVTAANGYSVAICTTPACTATSSLIDPATGQAFGVTLSDGVTLSPAGDALDFDSLGRPASGGTLLSTTPARIYTLSGSGRSVSVSVLPITGFAQTSY